jgi:hypothetical protein
MHLSDHVDHIVNPNKRSNIHWFATLAPERQSSVVLLLVGFLPSPVFLEKTPLKSTSSSIGWFRVLVKLSWFRCAGISLNLDRPTKAWGGLQGTRGESMVIFPCWFGTFCVQKGSQKQRKRSPPKNQKPNGHLLGGQTLGIQTIGNFGSFRQQRLFEKAT